MNIVRIHTLNGIKRFKPLSVSDYRDMIFIRNDIDNYDHDEKVCILNEMVGELFPELEPIERGYAFVKLFTSSIGKTKIPISYDCPECGKEVRSYFNLEQQPLKYPTLSVGDLTITFNLVDHIDTENLGDIFLNCIRTVEQGGVLYEWADIPVDQQNIILQSIDYEKFESVVETMTPIFFKLKVACNCNEGKPKEFIYSSLLSIFEVLIHPDEVFSFYRINHSMVGDQYKLDEIMNMLPVERSFYLSMIEKDRSKQK